MNVRSQVTASIAAIFAVLCAAEVFVARGVLLPSFAELERTEAQIAARRIEHGVGLTLDQLELSATDWGNWADTYQFSQDHNSAFIDQNMTPVGLKQLNINVMIVMDVTGRFLGSRTLDLKSGEPLGLDLAEQSMLPADFPWQDNLRGGRAARGFLRTDRGILMAAAAPILDGFGHGPAHGMVILGRLLSAAEIKRIGEQAQASVSLWEPHGAQPPNAIVADDNVLKVFRTFNDLYGRPAFALQVEMPREITRRGASAVRYASLYLMAAAVIVLVLLVVMLNAVVLNPLGRITRHAVAIGKEEDLTTRLDFIGGGEIGLLACEIDRMMARINETRSQLVDQSFHAGYAELARGVLHNLGNAMTPIEVRMANLHSRLRGAPVEDAQLAILELERERLDTSRRADLQEFLRLACEQLVMAIRAAEEDVSAISRQTAIVHAAMSEQMRSTRNEHVIEAVRLPDLLTQSLEVVPDSARQRLAIEPDRSLSDVGVVNIPRTVLRLVLQNFIINAADAVAALGKARGTLGIAAELRSQGAPEQLYLRCADDGVGIAPENLERVFEKGFSTKSKETNFGIGLHWCANAVGALGGRVWASSEGPGRGATLHVMVPLAARTGVSIVKAA
jgi:two-component system, NtrC family, sensor kinase